MKKMWQNKFAMQSAGALSFYLARLMSFALFCVIIISAVVRASGNIDVGADGSKYSYSETAGWFNWNTSDSGVTVSTGYLSGYLWHENLGWVHLGTAPANGLSYANDAETDYGVNRDTATGMLSGYAWGENAGWINFNPDYGGVSISTTGVFGSTDTISPGGWAWGENIGWMCFSSETFRVRTSALPPAPSELTVTYVGISSITWSWTDNSSGWAQEDGFRIYFTTSPETLAGTAAQDATSFTAIGLLSATTYSMYVQSYNTAWSSNLSTSSAVSGFTLSPGPGIPLLSSPLDNSTTNQINISFDWSDSTGPSTISGYEFKISTASDWTGTVYSSDTANSYATMTLSEARWYWTVRSSDTLGYYSSWASTWSIVIDTTTPSAVNNLSAVTGFAPGELELSWTSPGDDGTSGSITNGAYRIRYSTDIPASWTDAASNWTDFQYKYEMLWTTNTAPSENQSKTLTGLTEGSTYYLRIWTRDEIEGSTDWDGNWSDISNGATTWAQVLLLDVDVQPDLNLAFGDVAAGASKVLSTSFTVTNMSNAKVKYQLQLTGVPSGWTAKEGSGATGHEQIKVFALFTTSNPPLLGDFTDELAAANGGDMLRNSTYDIATSSGFALVNENESVKGYNCDVGSLRYLWFRFDAPASTGKITEQFITVTVTAQQE